VVAPDLHYPRIQKSLVEILALSEVAWIRGNTGLPLIGGPNGTRRGPGATCGGSPLTVNHRVLLL
jgi:hypothetical protein